MGSVCTTCGTEAAAGAGACPKCGRPLAAGVSETLPFSEEDKRRLAAITVAAEPLDPEAGGGTPRPDTTLSDPALASVTPGDPGKTIALPDEQSPGVQAAHPKATVVLSEHDALIQKALNPAAGGPDLYGGEPAPYVPPRASAPARKSKKGPGCAIAAVLAIVLAAAVGGLTFYLTQHTGLLAPRSEPREPGDEAAESGAPDDGDESASAESN